MILSDWLFFGVIAVLALNHVAVLPKGWQGRSWFFWPVQALNLVTATMLMAVGIPDLAVLAPFLNWVLGLLLIFHIVSNNNKLLRSRKRAAQEVGDGLDERRERVRAALAAGQEE